MGEILDLILEQKIQPFEIYIPKSTQLYFSEPQAIWLDYIYLAYTGQLLCDIANEFSHEQVPPEEHESVLFKIKVKDLEKLAETLLYISYSYENDSEDEEFNYTEYADDYVANVVSGKVTPAWPYFIEVCKEIGEEESNL